MSVIILPEPTGSIYPPAGATSRPPSVAAKIAARLRRFGADLSEAVFEATLEYRLRRARAFGLVHRLRPAGEDDAARIEGADRLVAHVERVQFTVHADLAHAAGDQLGVLGTEIEDQDSVGVNVLGHGHLSLRNSQTTRG